MKRWFKHAVELFYDLGVNRGLYLKEDRYNKNEKIGIIFNDYYKTFKALDNKKKVIIELWSIVTGKTTVYYINKNSNLKEQIIFNNVDELIEAVRNVLDYDKFHSLLLSISLGTGFNMSKYIDTKGDMNDK